MGWIFCRGVELICTALRKEGVLQRCFKCRLPERGERREYIATGSFMFVNSRNGSVVDGVEKAVLQYVR